MSGNKLDCKRNVENDPQVQEHGQIHAVRLDYDIEGLQKKFLVAKDRRENVQSVRFDITVHDNNGFLYV